MKLSSNGLRFEIDSQGDEQAPAVLLTMGLGMQLIAWPVALVQALVDAGFRVIRYDNRDIGLSSHLDELGQPNMGWQFIKSRLGLRLRAPYSLQDMANDGLGVLDALGVPRAHVIGVSMGGMVSQRIAAAAPERVLSLTSIMSSSGAPGLPGPGLPVVRAVLARPRSSQAEDVVANTLALFRVIGSPGHAQDMPALRAQLMAAVNRSYHPAGVLRQLMAITADTDRHTVLPRIQCPTLVLHGTADPLVPIACGRDTAARIPGARFEAIEGMGHDWPPGVTEQLVRHTVPHLQSIS